MSELRQDATTKEWVILAPERGKRPQQRPKRKPADDMPSWDSTCPFCPGNEAETPDEVFRIPSSDEPSGWEVRVVPNRFAALIPEGDITRIEEAPFFRKMGGFGIHEVIIESPSHDTPPALMSYEHIEKVLIAYQERYNALKKDKRLRHITIFKNSGWAAGTSLVHPHSQLVATPVIAPYYHRKFDVAHEYYADMGRCLYCDLIAWDLEKAYKRVVAETKEFVLVTHQLQTPLIRDVGDFLAGEANVEGHEAGPDLCTRKCDLIVGRTVRQQTADAVPPLDAMTFPQGIGKPVDALVQFPVAQPPVLERDGSLSGIHSTPPGEPSPHVATVHSSRLLHENF